MIKSELVARLAQRYPHLYHRDVERIVTTVLDEITKALADGHRVELRGFGAFSVKVRPARMGRNPRTGEPVSVDEKRAPFFRTGKELRERLNGGSHPGIVRLSTYLIGIPVVVVTAVVAIANRQIVTFSLDPFSLSHPAEAMSVRMPLFVLLLLVLAVGAVLGGISAHLSRLGRDRARSRAAGKIRLAGALWRF